MKGCAVDLIRLIFLLQDQYSYKSLPHNEWEAVNFVLVLYCAITIFILLDSSGLEWVKFTVVFLRCWEQSRTDSELPTVSFYMLVVPNRAALGIYI